MCSLGDPAPTRLAVTLSGTKGQRVLRAVSKPAPLGTGIDFLSSAPDAGFPGESPGADLC